MIARLAIVFVAALVGLVVGLGVADDITYAQPPSGLDQHFDRFFQAVAFFTLGGILVGIVVAAQLARGRHDAGTRWGSSIVAGLIVGFAWWMLVTML
jgi:hypothetical protein